MPNIYKKHISGRVPLEICAKVEKRFRFSDAEADIVIYTRALEESVRGVVLTSEDYTKIAKIAAENEQKRQGGKLP